MKMARRFSKRVENTAGKGEIPRYEQFLLFSQSFPKTYCRHVNTRACLEKSKGLMARLFHLKPQNEGSG